MKKDIKIRFVGKDWDKLASGEVPHPFNEFLPQNYNLIFSDEPDYVISKESRDFYRSVFAHCPNAPIRILFAGEAFVPDFNIFDYAIGFDHLNFGDRYFRLHTCNFFSFEFAYGTLKKDISDIEHEIAQKNKFCNFIYSNSGCNPYREYIFHEMNKISKVDSAGMILNNCGDAIKRNASQQGSNYDWRADKVKFQREYRYTIAAENSLYPGYTTEKLLNPMFSMSIPIYWGNPQVGEYFNSKSFINCHDFENLDDVREAVHALENNRNAYTKLLSEPWMTESQEASVIENKARYEQFLSKIFNQNISDARRRGDGTVVSSYEKTLRNRIHAYDITTGSRVSRTISKLLKHTIRKGRIF